VWITATAHPGLKVKVTSRVKVIGQRQRGRSDLDPLFYVNRRLSTTTDEDEASPK